LTTNAAPDPMTLHPVAGQPRVVLLRPLITSPLIEVGEFSYYDDPEFADEFETRNVLHHYGPARLIIGKFCALAAGTTFIMNGANHRMSGVSTFPFPIMGGPWAAHIDLVTDLPSARRHGDRQRRMDRWKSHDHARSAHRSWGDCLDRIGGHQRRAGLRHRRREPATHIRDRFAQDEVRSLVRLAWWDWPIDVITENIRTIAAGHVKDVEQIAQTLPR
jgi:virginiamycin A acetyltransferase